MTAPLRSERCETCTWWSNLHPSIATGARRPAGADPLLGSCHRDSPQIVLSGGIYAPMFPEVHAHQFCAAWRTEGGSGPKGGEEVDNIIPIRSVA